MWPASRRAVGAGGCTSRAASASSAGAARAAGPARPACRPRHKPPPAPGAPNGAWRGPQQGGGQEQDGPGDNKGTGNSRSGKVASVNGDGLFIFRLSGDHAASAAARVTAFLTSKQRFAHENDCVVDAGGGDRAVPVRHPGQGGRPEVRQQRPASLAGAAGRLAGARQRGAEQCRGAAFLLCGSLVRAAQPGRRDARGHADGVLAGLRLGYLAMYVAGWGALRSLVWATSIGFTIAILFTGV